MEIIVEAKTSVATGDFGAAAARLSLKLEGRKTWMAHNRLRFETSGHNLDALVSAFPSAMVQDKRLSPEQTKVLGELQGVVATMPEPAFVLPPRNFQLENFHRFKDMPQWAIFSEQGTGKTKVAFDIICWRFLRGTVTGVIVFSIPKGVHAQWVEEQAPKHMWPTVPHLMHIWDGKKPPAWVGKTTPELQLLSGNIDMLKSKAGWELLQVFARQHKARLLILVDESDAIKNKESGRSKKLRELAAVTQQRAIMTGTPIAKDLIDEWAQFYFLNPDIVGHKYVTSFKAQYCVMGGDTGDIITGYRNVDGLKRLMAPYIFRATKADLDLPEKVRDDVVFDLGTTQKRLIKELRAKFFATLTEQGPTVAVKNGATALLRIQQISNGFMVDEGGSVNDIENPRLSALEALLKDTSGSRIIWCRFKEDVRRLKAALPGAVTIFGEDNQPEREAAKKAFLSGAAELLIATPGAAGRGLDGLQTVCSTAIYYSNSYNAIERWQSEDRIHRIGMVGTATYFDLIARGSIDRAILANLKWKRDIASLALDDIKQIMEQIE